MKKIMKNNLITGGIYTFNNDRTSILIGQDEDIVYFFETRSFMSKKVNTREGIIENVVIFCNDLIADAANYYYSSVMLEANKEHHEEPTGFIGTIPDKTLAYIRAAVENRFFDTLDAFPYLWKILES